MCGTRRQLCPLAHSFTHLFSLALGRSSRSSFLCECCVTLDMCLNLSVPVSAEHRVKARSEQWDAAGVPGTVAGMSKELNK